MNPINWHEFIYYVAVCLDSDFSKLMLQAIHVSGPSPKHLPIIDAAALYALVRVTRPRIIVEIGTFRGMSTSFLRQAQIDSSIEGASIYTVDHEPAHQLGLMIPASLKDGIHQVVGDIRDPGVRSLLPCSIDMYFHDSNHRYSFQEWEYNVFWPLLGSRGLLASHDVDKSGAFPAFLGTTYMHNSEGYAENTTQHGTWGRIGKLGFLQKP